MENLYEAPRTKVVRHADVENTSGMGKGYDVPEGVKGWSWGACYWNWIWAIGNKTWIGLLGLIPYVGFVMAIVLGVKGREWAWQNKRWESVEHFNAVQRKWSRWAGIFVLVGLTLMIVILIASLVLEPASN